MSRSKLSDRKNIIGKNLVLLRKSLKLKQYQLAKKLNTSAGYLSEVENGKKIPGSDFLYSLKINFNINIDSLFVEEKSEQLVQEAITACIPTENRTIKTDSEKSDLIQHLKKQIEDLRLDKQELRKDKAALESDKQRLLKENEDLKKERFTPEKSENSA